MGRRRGKTARYETQEETIHLDLPLACFNVPVSAEHTHRSRLSTATS
jgi:hypothetical protein